MTLTGEAASTPQRDMKPHCSTAAVMKAPRRVGAECVFLREHGGRVGMSCTRPRQEPASFLAGGRADRLVACGRVARPGRVEDSSSGASWLRRRSESSSLAGRNGTSPVIHS